MVSGNVYPMDLVKGKYVPPPAGVNLSPEDMKKLLGQWVGKLQAPNAPLTVVLRFENTKDGTFAAFMDSPDQGAKGLLISEQVSNRKSTIANRIS
jgi:hypothetical protein